MNRTNFFQLKRFVDVGVSAAGLLALGPAVLVAGAFVLSESPGPAFFRSRRVGRGGKEFDLMKLRTMVVNQAGDAPQVTAGSDNRITRVGRVLRQTKLDEIPQLWNVLVGDVSLVGPRPEVLKFVEKFPSEYAEILSVRPGLSDRATLMFIDEEEQLKGQDDPEAYYVKRIMPKKLEIYLDYVRNASLYEDMQIIGETSLAVLRKVFRTLMP